MKKLTNLHNWFCDVYYDACDRTRRDELSVLVLGALVIVLAMALCRVQAKPADIIVVDSRVKWHIDHGYKYAVKLGPVN